jgi:hypothetical protein
MIKIQDLSNGKVRITVGGYSRITALEGILIARYLLNFDKSPILEVIRSGEFISRGFRIFLADLLDGKIKAKKPRNIDRDNRIYLQVDALLGAMPITDAINKVASQVNLEESGIAKIYYRMAQNIAETQAVIEQLKDFGKR